MDILSVELLELDGKDVRPALISDQGYLPTATLVLCLKIAQVDLILDMDSDA